MVETASVESVGRLGGGRTRVDTEVVAWWPSRRFTGLGLKTGGESGAAGCSRWRARGVITKLASRRSEVVKAACPFDSSRKRWTNMPLSG